MIVLTKTTQESVIQLILQEHCHPVCIDDRFEATSLNHYPMNVDKCCPVISGFLIQCRASFYQL